MSKKGTLVLFRHGQTDYNEQNLLTGLRDATLTAKGEDQAREAGKKLSGFVFDKAFSSTLSRSFNTAALALESSEANNHLKNATGDWKIEQRREIVEGDSGDFSGRNKLTDPEIIAFPRGYDTPLPNGESDKQVVERIRKFYQDELLPRMKRGETVLVVSHAGVMKAFEIAAGLRPEPTEDLWSKRWAIPNAAPAILEYDDGALIKHHWPRLER